MNETSINKHLKPFMQGGIMADPCAHVPNFTVGPIVGETFFVDANLGKGKSAKLETRNGRLK